MANDLFNRPEEESGSAAPLEEKANERTLDVVQEKAKARLEQQEAELKAEGKWKDEPDAVQFIGSRYNPIQIRDGKADTEYLFANRDQRMVAMHRSEGWKPSRFDDADEHRAGNDLVQMEMSKGQYEKTVLAPELARRKARIASIETEFHDAGELAAQETNGGVETFGRIKLDRGR